MMGVDIMFILIILVLVACTVLGSLLVNLYTRSEEIQLEDGVFFRNGFFWYHDRAGVVHGPYTTPVEALASKAEKDGSG